MPQFFAFWPCGCPKLTSRAGTHSRQGELVQTLVQHIHGSSCRYAEYKENHDPMIQIEEEYVPIRSNREAAAVGDITFRTFMLRKKKKKAKIASRAGHGQIIRLSMDGMDQAKFKMPQSFSGSADLSDCWHPALEDADGDLAAYFIMNPDLRTDSTLNCAVVGRMPYLVYEGSFRSKDGVVPRSLAVGFDNACRRGENSVLSALVAFTCATKVFEDTTLENLQPGHSHNQLDQFFSLISRASVLKDCGLYSQSSDPVEWLQAADDAGPQAADDAIRTSRQEAEQAAREHLLAEIASVRDDIKKMFR